MNWSKRAGVQLDVQTPSGFSFTGEVGLPDDLLQQSVGRVRVLAGVAAVLTVMSLTANTVLHYAFDSSPFVMMSVASRTTMLVLDIVVFLALGSGRPSLMAKHRIGLVFEVLGAAMIVKTEALVLPAIGLEVGPVSFACLWMLAFRLIVMTTPKRALITTFASGAMVPLTLWFVDSEGLAPVSEMAFLTTTMITLGVAVIAFVSSRMLYGLGSEVMRARQLGSYRLEEPLGAGGMGEVWRASHRMLKRPAAIKLIRRSGLSSAGDTDRAQSIKRFEREARATASLKSKHTVQLYDFGTARDGSFYYVMELLDGLDLETLVTRHGPVPPERAVHFLLQVCHSLMEAHEMGMVHRDIKPANMIACRLGPDVDFVKVLDFGLVKERRGARPDAGASASLTHAGAAVGTPGYMAPEAALGVEITPAADIYTLGCVAYFLLTGKLVFEGSTAMELISHHVAAVPVAPSERTELPIPAELEALVMACLSKAPADRPASMREIRERLQACPLEAAWTEQRAQRWWEAHRPAGG